MGELVVLCTIPYTGTSFTAKMFQGQGYVQTGLNDNSQGRAIMTGHMLKETQIGMALDLAKKHPLICTLRHPYRVEEAFRKRNADVAQVSRAFRTLTDRFLPLNPYIMAVDSPVREKCLEEMREGLGLNLNTDWSVVGSRSQTHDKDLSEFEPSDDIKTLVRKIWPFLSEYYGNS